ncbi:efflux RND transporter periplasmic adaptor subunit [Rhizobium skierniewicense]|uniref:efflux RND transporter periplasmic adaptor subunit n=1 Tax=Rhizobium skierniewicense TaxID=984260 RepID=UPI00157466EE|nr:efflux RND transporter periplasmic adaptor subunit [Rhizobium skierniewicense]NTF34455.1 efflux RND transporter periplasmic adaptor subunit [Rhizobium skierniewicense]
MTKKFLISSSALIAVAGVAVAAFVFWPNQHVSATADPRTAAPYVSMTDAKLPASVTRSLTGTVAARVQSDLGFRVPGKIVERLVNLGDDVKAGQPLMRIDETDLRLARTAKKNAVAAAQATFVQALADEKRFSSLVKTNAASTQQYERAKAALDTAEAQLSAAQAEANVADNEATYSVLYADVDGTVVDTLGESGQVVAAGQAVIRLAKAGAREAVIWMPENIRPEVGTVASASIYGREGQDKAVLRQISASADPRTRTYETRWVLQGTAAETPLGATVSVNIPNKDAQTHAEIPVGAIIDDGTRSGVWVVDKAASIVRFREIKVERLGEENAIVSGLTAGEEIVALGAHLLSEGSPVRTTIEKAEVTK